MEGDRLTFLIGMGGKPGGKAYRIFQQYGVSGYPTNYLLDSTGQVVWRGSGFEGDLTTLRAALKKLGLE